jgi:hypothetical protein
MESAFIIVRAVLPLVALIVLMIGARLCLRMFLGRRWRPVDPNRCKCGYTLAHLSVPRCPECGRVIHFDATPEQLGLTDQELQRAQAVRLRRMASAKEGPPKQG